MGCSPSRRPMKCLVVGLDNSGKSTVVNHLKPVKLEEVNPTVGLLVENFQIKQLKGMKCTMYDMSGAEEYRNLWEHYYKECNGVVFVIDSSDSKRMGIVKEEIKRMLSHTDMGKNKAPVLFLANKMDLMEAKASSELRSTLGLDTIKDRSWHITSTNAKTGEGVMKGMEWLRKNL
mmetsp:Transcript_16886/g.30257  ORF Transcript_16886/g.30257 Transcript_16886/m.30257 type:complete len:175 (-) Transcript_16886:211-735(-)